MILRKDVGEQEEATLFRLRRSSPPYRPGARAGKNRYPVRKQHRTIMRIEPTGPQRKREEGP